VIDIKGNKILEGDKMLLVIAPAKRDNQFFEHSESFDIQRTNNNEQLSFESGAHACIAMHFECEPRLRHA
jgi:cytochrome P450